MYVTIYRTEDDGDGGAIITVTDYTAVKALSFAPQADLIASALPVNEFTADLVTEDDIYIGDYGELYDDRDRLWARYWVSYAERVEAGTTRVTAKSLLALLSQAKLPARRWVEKDAAEAIWECFYGPGPRFGMETYALDSSFDEVTLDGFVPEQTARERLLWILFSIGGYARTAFNDVTEILPLDDTETLVPLEATFWKPTVIYNDWVTAVRAKTYSFALGDPEPTDTYVTDENDNHYIVTEGEVTLANPDAPAAAPENVVEVEGVYLVNDDNVDDILTRLAQRHFKRIDVELDAVNNGDYVPGDRLTVYADTDRLYSGHLESAEFQFGLQARAKLRVVAAEAREAGNLTITYTWNGASLARRVYTLPVGYDYSIRNPYIDKAIDGHRYVFRPTQTHAEGTVAEGDNAVTVPCEVALDSYRGTLHVLYVDDIQLQTSGSDEIGVIA